MKEFLWGESTISLEAAVLKCPNAELYLDLYLPSEGRHAEDFYTCKNPMASAGFEPVNSGTRGQHANH
jgi:hypothetical protein